MYHVKKEIVAEKVARGIIEYILVNKLKPGDKLPTERELSESFKVGRPAVREALCALSMMRIIEIRHGDGSYFSEMNSGGLRQIIQIYMDLGMIAVDEYYELRILLEAEAASLAAEHITDEEIEQIREYVEESGRSVADGKLFISYDLKIHEAIFAATKNLILERIISSFRGFAQSSRDLTSNYRELRELAHIGHRKIFEALEKRDKEAAMKSMREHLKQVKKFFDLDKTIYQEQISKLVRNEIVRDLNKNRV